MAGNQQAQLSAFCENLDKLDTLTVKSVAIPEPKQGEVLAKVLLAPVNPTDVHQLQGLRPIGCMEFPQTGGTEGLGEIVKLGPGASKFKVGQRVVGAFWPGAFTGSGTWQQYLTAPEDVLVAVPDRLSDESASQFVVNPLTAFGLVQVAQVPKGGWLLHTGASSVLGRMFVILAKRQGLKTINVVRRSVHKKTLYDLGADVVIGTDEEDVVKRVLEVTDGKGAYTSIDSVGGDEFDDIVSATRNGGTIIGYGCLSGKPCKITSREMFYKLKKVEGFLLGVWLASLGDKKQATFEEVMTLLADKVIEPLSGDVYPLKDIAKAVADSEKQGRGGKLFVKP